jgi:exodeoxyribonuclease V beta subunit
MKELDLTGVPLDGAHLIEASAGTGKTYAIGSLYLRLLLEKGLAVDQILVVTYTVAATEELKTRIRENIRQALSAFKSGCSNDAFINALLLSCTDHDRAVLVFDHALKLFDEAAIFTIHGFCQRVLAEMAFESASLFDAELISDQRDILREVVDDFYRLNFYDNMPPELARYALNKKITLESLLKILGKASIDADIIPIIDRPEAGLHIASYRQAFEEVKDCWCSQQGEVAKILLKYPGLHRNLYRTSSIPKWIDAMNTFIDSNGEDLPLFDTFKKFTASTISESLKNDYDPPEHVFFDLCEDLKNRADELVACIDEYLIWLKRKLFEYVKTHLAEKKDKMGVFHFDDLLLKVHSCLVSSSGKMLGSALRDKYRAALIDEFQDTDPVQYGIFKTAFEGLPMFLIGDPKQAIYSFRGADIFTYLNAAMGISSDNKHTLKKNWRSDEALIHAVNRIFSRPTNHNPFVFDQIGFEPVDAAEKEGRVALRDSQGAPLTLWFVPAEGSRVLNKREAERAITRAVAMEVSRLLEEGSDGHVLIGEEAVMPGDIAVLVRENRQARLVRDELSACGIPCVIYSEENVFDSYEAFEMEVFLKGVAQPHSEGLIRAALATSLIGLDSQEIEAETFDEGAWEQWLIKFLRYHDLWVSKGFMRMFREFITGENVRQKLLALKRGERMLTNFLHIAELLNQAAVDKKLGMSDLLKWLALQRDPGLNRAGEYQLRLESDEDAVKIQTVHKSKGLEYPIVFSPFSWGASEMRRDDKDRFLFHDRENNWKATFDLGSGRIEENRKHAEKEALAENMRLLYVALTRAKNRCYIVWGAFNNAQTSAPAYLLHSGALGKDSDGIEPLKQMSLVSDSMMRDLADLEKPPSSPVLVQDIPRAAPIHYMPPSTWHSSLVPREFTGRIDRSWKVLSFSSMTYDTAHTGEAADYDALYAGPSLENEGADAAGYDIFSFPRGARAGTMMHTIFERLDFQADGATLSKLVSTVLDSYGYDESWHGVIVDMVKKVLAAPIDDFTLSGIKTKERLSELEFYFPLNHVSKSDLADCFSSSGTGGIFREFPAMIEGLHFDPSRGFMRGFIDLVFGYNGRYYIVDWKSNYLGNTVDDYNRAALGSAMRNNYYILQYHLYTLAVHQYLRRRLKRYSYDEHFGGVVYVFLRGVDPASGEEYGIYHARPSQEFVENLSKALIASE